MGETITFTRPDGHLCSGYYAPAAQSDSVPAVVVLQEWWGVNEQIKGVADRLSAQGYRALVPDLYRGEMTLEAAEARHLSSNLDFADAATQDIRGAVRHLKQDSPRVAVLGFCMGGALSLLAAIHVPELDAAVSWYGIPPEESGDLRTINIPFQGHFAEQDHAFPLERVEALEAQLQQGDADYEIYRYQAQHAFGNEKGERYDPQAAQLAWERTYRFLQQRISPASE